MTNVVMSTPGSQLIPMPAPPWHVPIMVSQLRRIFCEFNLLWRDEMPVLYETLFRGWCAWHICKTWFWDFVFCNEHKALQLQGWASKKRAMSKLNKLQSCLLHVPGYTLGFNTAFRGGSVMGYALCSLGVLVLWALLTVFRKAWSTSSIIAWSFRLFSKLFKTLVTIRYCKWL